MPILAGVATHAASLPAGGTLDIGIRINPVAITNKQRTRNPESPSVDYLISRLWSKEGGGCLPGLSERCTMISFSHRP